MRNFFILCLLLGLAACSVPIETGPPLAADVARRNFQSVVSRIKPVAIHECKTRTKGLNCNFQIKIDPDTDEPPNAYQTLDNKDRPVIVFTDAPIKDARNQDELAIILGHEAAHHLAGHLERQMESALAGAIIMGSMAEMGGADQAQIDRAIEAGAAIGALAFSKEYELEADALGAVIAQKAGYDAVNGANYFARIPDPGNMFLGSHPQNKKRLKVIKASAKAMKPVL